MKAGTFNINDYLERLTEEAEAVKASEKTPDKEGLIIPDSNEKAYKWLQSEYKKGQTEVKVEMKLGNSKFNPGYELQTNLKSVKEFKPGMFGQANSKETTTGLKTNNFGGKETKQEEPKKAEAEETKKPQENLPKPAVQKTASGTVPKKATTVPKPVEQQKKEVAPSKFKIKKAEIK